MQWIKFEELFSFTSSSLECRKGLYEVFVVVLTGNKVLSPLGSVNFIERFEDILATGCTKEVTTPKGNPYLSGNFNFFTSCYA